VPRFRVVGKAQALPRLRVVAKARALPQEVRVANARVPFRMSSNGWCRPKQDAPWKTWHVPRFPSCKLVSHKPVTARL